MRVFLFLAILCSILTPFSGKAQIFTLVIDEFELQTKVKLIDEFFSRFNFEIDYKGDPVEMSGDNEIDSIRKVKTITGLLDLDKYADKEARLDSLSAGFVEFVVANNKQIHYADSTWYAKATSSLIMDKKEYPVTFFLQTEHVKDKIYRWVIKDVTSPIFSALTDTLTMRPSIFPGAHGSSFITLPETINLNAKEVTSLFYQDFKPDLLSVFAYLIATHKITISNVTKVVYYFDISNYSFKVERIEKNNSYNQGWLITEIIKR